jgi:hypothetical protein
MRRYATYLIPPDEGKKEGTQESKKERFSKEREKQRMWFAGFATRRGKLAKEWQKSSGNR